MFSATEALALVTAVIDDGHHDVSDPTDAVGSALSKIVRVLPESVAAQVDAIRRTTAPAPDRAAVRPDPKATSELVQACSNHRRVRIDYRSEAGTEWVAEVDPWAVVVRHGRWYHEAVGRCLPRSLGRLEPLGPDATVLIGSTGNPWWYAEQLAAIPASYRSSGASSCNRPRASSGSGCWPAPAAWMSA